MSCLGNEESQICWYFLTDYFPYLLCVKANTIRLIGSRSRSETVRPCNVRSLDRTDRRGLNNWILGRSQSVITGQSIPLKGTHYTQTFRHTEPHISSSFFWHLLDSLVIMMDPMMVLNSIINGNPEIESHILGNPNVTVEINLTGGVESMLW